MTILWSFSYNSFVKCPFITRLIPMDSKHSVIKELNCTYNIFNKSYLLSYIVCASMGSIQNLVLKNVSLTVNKCSKIVFWFTCFIFFLLQTFRLLAEEGLFVGASSGLNVSAAYQLAKQMGPGHTVVTCLCDTGQVGCHP